MTEFYPRGLAANHRKTLVEGSAIDPDLLEGVYTITNGRDLPKGFSARQRRRAPGILFEFKRPNGQTAYSFRPDDPDPNKPGRKYEQPAKACGGAGNVLAVYATGQRGQAQDTSVPVVFVEGVKKALSLISAVRAASVELVVVAISGVWNWLSDSKPIPDMLEIPVEGRKTTVLFDSDMVTNPNVQEAARRLAEHLISRRAEVFITFLHDRPDGSKTGADDFFAGGGTFRELRLLIRPYDPADFVEVRLGRDGKLKALVEDLERRHVATRWVWPGADADEDVFLKLIEAARRHGRIVADGLRVVKAQGPLALEAKLSSRTLWKSLNRLEERHFLKRDNEGRKPDKAGAFVLRASVRHYEEREADKGEATKSLELCGPGDLHPRAPRLYASRPKWKPTKKMVREHRLGVRTWMPEPREGLKRLGKKRAHCLDRLDVAGGTLTLVELGERIGVRPRDLVRRKTTEKGRDGLLIWLRESGIVSIDEGTVSLAPDWLERLDKQRELGEEIEADEVARRRYKAKSSAYHNRKKNVQHRSKPSAAGLAAVRRSEERRDACLQEAARAEEERRRAGPPPALQALISRSLAQLDGGHLERLRMGLLCEEAMDRGFGWRDVSDCVRAWGYRVERLAEYNDAEFVFPKEVAV